MADANPGLLEQFELAARFIVEYQGDALKSSLSNEIRLRFYGLYKQAREGDCGSKQPSFYDVTGRAKHAAWSALRGMGRGEAQAAYVKALDDAYPAWRGWE